MNVTVHGTTYHVATQADLVFRLFVLQTLRAFTTSRKAA